MRTFRFKSNIRCAGCVNKVRPHLDRHKGILKWSVDILSPEKYLSVEAQDVNAETISDLVAKAGFNAEYIP